MEFVPAKRRDRNFQGLSVVLFNIITKLVVTLLSIIDRVWAAHYTWDLFFRESRQLRELMMIHGRHMACTRQVISGHAKK